MNNTLLMPFVDKSESFTNGFECGLIWQMVIQGDTFTDYLIHAENTKQIEMICETFGVEYEIKRADEWWAHLTVKSVKI